MSIRSPRSSPERRLALGALLLAGLAVAGGAPAAAQSGVRSGTVPSAEVRARARAALADPRFQRALPGHDEDEEDASRRRRAESPAAVPGGGEPLEVSLPVLGAGAVLAKVIFIVLLVVAGVLLVGWITRELLARWRGADPRTGLDAEAASPVSTGERALVFDDASRLAAEGRYAEAVHALLLAAIRHFAERSRTSIQPSRTSRELVRLLPLGPEAREAFAELVRTVELSLFGGADVQAEDYERNLARFQALTRRTA